MQTHGLTSHTKDLHVRTANVCHRSRNHVCLESLGRFLALENELCLAMIIFFHKHQPTIFSYFFPRTFWHSPFAHTQEFWGKQSNLLRTVGNWRGIASQDTAQGQLEGDS